VYLIIVELLNKKNQTVGATNRRKTNATVVIIDANPIKRVNDSYGHVEGDKIPYALGQLLVSTLRETDSVV